MMNTASTDKRVVYLDNNATTAVAPEVLEAMLPYYEAFYGNPSSVHYFGGQVKAKMDIARQQVAVGLGAQPEEIIFTSCGTESDSTAILSALRAAPHKRHLVTTRVEHPAIMNLAQDLARQGYEVTFLPVDRLGNLDLEQVKEAVREDTAVVSVMWANNETGVIFPVEEIARIAKSKGAIFHSDAVQTVGKIPIDLGSSAIDMLSLSGHKLHTPKGVGALYVKKGTPFVPFLLGGHQERGRRAGTENVPYIIGLGRAFELAGSHMAEKVAHIRRLRDRLEAGLLRLDATMLNGDPLNRVAGTSSVSFEFIEGESILMLLSDQGICASSGSACTSGSLEPSHVLRAMGVPFTAAHGSIRFSFSGYNSDADVDLVLEVMPGIVDKLRTISPFWQQNKKASRHG
jgi:cysteine desulfurase